MSKSSKATQPSKGHQDKQDIFEITCPDCGGILRVDAKLRAVVSHTPAPRKRTFEDFEGAARAMRDQEERTHSLFRQAVDAEKNKDDIFEKRFAEALKKAKESPATERPLREFDLE